MALFVVCLLFFVGPSATGHQVWFLVLNLFHVGRAVVGFYLTRLIPMTHDWT